MQQHGADDSPLKNDINMTLLILIARFFAGIWKQLSKWYWTRYDLYRGRPKALKRSICRAKKMHRKNKKRYKVYFLQHKYQVLTRMDIQRKKKDGTFLSYINRTKMKPFEFFDTETMMMSEFAKELLATKNL